MTLELYIFYIALFVSFLMIYMDFRYLIAWKYISGPLDKDLQDSRWSIHFQDNSMLKYKVRRPCSNVRRLRGRMKSYKK